MRAIEVSQCLPQQSLRVGERAATAGQDALKPAQPHPQLLVGRLDAKGLGAFGVLLGLADIALSNVQHGSIAIGVALLGGVLLGLVRADTGVKPLRGTGPVAPRRAAAAGGHLVFAVTGGDAAEVVE